MTWGTRVGISTLTSKDPTELVLSHVQAGAGAEEAARARSRMTALRRPGERSPGNRPRPPELSVVEAPATGGPAG